MWVWSHLLTRPNIGALNLQQDGTLVGEDDLFKQVNEKQHKIRYLQYLHDDKI